MAKILQNLNEIHLFSLKRYTDNRGEFYENFNIQNFDYKIKQSNISISKKKVLRGIHYQINKPIGYIITVIKGSIFDIAIDLRKDSKNFLKRYSFNLNDKSEQNLYIPAGFGHGFLCLSSYCIVNYLCNENYNLNYERGINCFDKTFNIDWPIKDVILNERDRQFPEFHSLLPDQLP